MTPVHEFRARYGLAPLSPPLRPPPADVRLQGRRIREEFEEVMVELEILAHTASPVAVVDCYRRLLKELADLRYCVDGCAVAFALPIDAAFEAVHASNMTKSLALDGAGKVVKGEGYIAPDMALLVHDIITVQEVSP